jgi:hypothetical protein
MSKKFQLTIEEPCHEKWNNMAPADKGRFCDSCQKQVIDFTGMSDSQLVAFFKKPSTGSLCGRFNADQLNHDLEIPRKRIPWLKYFFTIALPAFFATSKATAQGFVSKMQIKGNSKTVTVNDKKTLGAPSYISCDKPALPDSLKELEPNNLFKGNVLPYQNSDSIIPYRIVLGGFRVAKVKPQETFSGKVINETGEPLPFATITLKGTNTRAKADGNGNFKIFIPEKKPTLIATRVGYEPSEIVPGKNSNDIVITMIKQQDEVWLGEVMPKPAIRWKPISLIPIVNDTAFKNFKFYPNPSTTGSTLTFEWNKPEKGEFEIQLLNQQGQVMNRKYENFIEKRNSIQYTIPQVTPGSYFLVLANRKSGKKITEKIIIQ